MEALSFQYLLKEKKLNHLNYLKDKCMTLTMCPHLTQICKSVFDLTPGFLYFTYTDTYRRLATFVNKQCALDFRHIVSHVLELAMRD